MFAYLSQRSSSYTYGKPINGKVTLIMKLQSFYYSHETNDNSTEPPQQIIRSADMVNGKAKFDLNVRQYKDSFLSFRTAPLDITATVEENFTGVKINGTTGATLYRDRYFISCQVFKNCNWFIADEETEMTFRVLSYDDAILRDINAPVRLRFTESLSKNYYKDENKTEPKINNQVFEFEGVLDINSTAVFKVKLPALEKFDGYTHFYKIKAFYKDEVHDVMNIYQKEPPKVTDNKAVEPTTPKSFFKAQLEYPKGRST